MIKHEALEQFTLAIHSAQAITIYDYIHNLYRKGGQTKCHEAIDLAFIWGSTIYKTFNYWRDLHDGWKIYLSDKIKTTNTKYKSIW